VDRAAGCSRDARRAAQTPERDGQWQQDRVVRRLLLPGRRAVRTPCGTRRAGWNGLRGRSRLRRPPPPPRGAPCARRPPSASGAGTHRTPQRCAGVRVAASHPHKPISGIRARTRSEGRLRFCIVSSYRFRKRDPQSRIANDCLFCSAARSVVIMALTKSRDFFLREFQWFIIEPMIIIGTGAPVQNGRGFTQNPRGPPHTGFFFFSPSRLRRRTEK